MTRKPDRHGPKTDPETGPKASPEAGPKIDPQRGAKAGPRTGAKTRAEAPTDTGAGTKTDTGTNAGRAPNPRTPTPRTSTPRTPTTRNAAVGDYGERVAARFLADAGLVVLDRNWRCVLGELDLVARDGPTLVACEVKTRRIPTVEHPLAAVTPDKAERLRRLAERWIAEHPGLAVPGCDVRIDLVAVLPSHRGAARVEHVRGAC